MLRRRFKPAAGGGCEVRLPRHERELLSTLPLELHSSIVAIGEVSRDGAVEMPESLRRLFPPAYTTDDESERRYRDLTRSDLLEHHSEALSVLSASAATTYLSEEEVAQWLTALNDLRLVLGTVLDVSDLEDELDVRSSQHLLYYYLGGLEEELVGVMSGFLPEPVAGADDSIPEDPWGEPLGGLRWDGTPLPTRPPPGDRTPEDRQE